MLMMADSSAVGCRIAVEMVPCCCPDTTRGCRSIRASSRNFKTRGFKQILDPTFYAEGIDGNEVVFTSRLDDTFGAGGTFDTNNDGISDNAAPGDWGGLIFRQDATGSLDFADVRFGGGSTPTQGSFTEFNAIEILQADVRITNSTIHDNASGFVTNSIREGVGFNDDAAIFVRGAQPIILNNVIEANDGAAISINPDAMDFNDRLDVGRSTGPLDLIQTDRDNQGPLISGNR